MDRLAPMRRPPGPAQGSQRWHRLLFSHWEVPAAALRPLVPARLALDDFAGRYYVGAVSFTMQNVRPFRWAPAIPTARDFGEVNLRTYVHVEGREPGVYFFSLDAASALVVFAARMFWGLPYFRADVRTAEASAEAPSEVSYRASRGRPRVVFASTATLGSRITPPEASSREYFLCERYQFYAERRGKLRRARVHHAPYELHTVQRSTVSDSLLHAAGLPSDGARTPDLFSPGVDVEVFALEDV